MTSTPVPPPPINVPPPPPIVAGPPATSDPPLLHQKPLPAPQTLPPVDRDANGRFAPGNPGKRFGQRHRTTVAIENLMGGQWETLTQTVIQAALRGDMAAARLCLERIVPPRRGSIVSIDDFPEIKSVADIPAAHAALVAAVANGQISAEEAAPISSLLANYVSAVEATELAERLAELERLQAGGEKTINHGS